MNPTDTLEALEALVKQHGLPGDPKEIADIVTMLPDTSTGWYVGAAVTLAAEVKRLREALEPFAKAADIKLCGEWRDDQSIQPTDTASYVTFGDLRRAREALEPRA